MTQGAQREEAAESNSGSHFQHFDRQIPFGFLPISSSFDGKLLEIEQSLWERRRSVSRFPWSFVFILCSLLPQFLAQFPLTFLLTLLTRSV